MYLIPFNSAKPSLPKAVAGETTSFICQRRMDRAATVPINRASPQYKPHSHAAA